MTDELSFGLADLEVTDDLNVSMDNETYQDQANPAPPAAGIYNFKAIKLDARRNKDKEPVFEGGDSRFPILTLVTVEIVEGLSDASGNPTTRKVAVFQDIKTKPFNRNGSPASNLGDITRAYGTDSWAGIPAGLAALRQAFETGGTFAAGFDWSIYDGELVKAAIEQLEIPADKDNRDENQKKLIGAVYNAARVTGMRFFPYNENTGRFSNVLVRENVVIKNPVTNSNVTIEVPHRTFEARGTITRYYPKQDVESGRVKFGPARVKPAAAVAA